MTVISSFITPGHRTIHVCENIFKLINNFFLKNSYQCTRIIIGWSRYHHFLMDQKSKMAAKVGHTLVKDRILMWN